MEITLFNADGRDAQVAAESVRIPVRIRRLDADGYPCNSQRILKGTLDRGYAALQTKFGDNLGQALIADDPELDLETVGLFLRDTSRVYVDQSGHVIHALTHMEIVRNPDGSEKARRPHRINASNMGTPLLWSGKFIPRAQATGKFVFASKRQILHINGLTYDFLFGIARELEKRDALLLIGAGPKGASPLIFRRGALPYRGFLEGRTKGAAYLLILHLSNLELKAPGECAVLPITSAA